MAFLIISISIPAILHLSSDLEDDSNVMMAMDGAGRIKDAMTQAYFSGEGSKHTVEVSTGHCMLSIGGEGAEGYGIKVLFDDQERGAVYLQRPTIKVLGGPLKVMGDAKLLVECVKLHGDYGVTVSIVD